MSLKLHRPAPPQKRPISRIGKHVKSRIDTTTYTLQSVSSALAARNASILVVLFAIVTSLALGLSLNTSRDIYHINHQTLDAQEFRKLNHLPSSTKTTTSTLAIRVLL